MPAEGFLPKHSPIKRTVEANAYVAHGGLRRWLRAELEDLEIDPLAALLLRFMHRSGGGAPIATMTEAFSLPKSTTATAVTRLERRGWVKRSPLPLDRRGRMVMLTDVGRVFAKPVSETIGDLEQQILYIAGSDLLEEFNRLASYLAAAEEQPFGSAW